MGTTREPYTLAVLSRRIHAALPATANSLMQVLDSVSCDVARLDAFRPEPVMGIGANDLNRLFGYQIEFLGRSAVFAKSHMNAMATVVSVASSVYSPLVLCRSALESLGHLYWAADEQLGSHGRLLGTMRARMKDQQKALLLRRDYGSEPEIKEAEAIIKSDRRASDALKAGMSKAQYKRTKPLSPTDAVTKLMPEHATKRMTAYEHLSEHSHGNTTWVDAREFTDLESLRLMQPTQATVETFLLPVLWSLEGMSQAFGRARKIMPLEFDADLLAGRIAHLVQIAQDHGGDDVWPRI